MQTTTAHVHGQAAKPKRRDIMNLNESSGPTTRPEASRARRISLRHIVIIAVSAALGSFAWNRTGGDYLLSALIVCLTASAIDVRVTDSGK
ncbi:hypothetical protein BJ973_001308 [Actinoplanes tereljensis]|uniref:Uncharacterized protein n=1 Tax=Paractinoplanes tereljensis TaxID=571912 RepID=A0A919NMQ6_9ACTN|nr:hypothetical protein [Actinoplanes tereljensis]GIF20786.1 hypothetical protein Ate02nite_35160 [Actinoplanes tereljensis]